MQIEEIERFLLKQDTDKNYVKISFKKRESFYGLFIMGDDFSYLKEKNFWRIVPQNQLSAFSQTKNLNLAKIFSGSEFTRLTMYKESFEV